MAIVQGVGYEHPSFSHFSSMAYWHTGAPNSGDAYGWLGRLADAIDPAEGSEFLVNVQSGQSLAVRARAPRAPGVRRSRAIRPRRIL